MELQINERESYNFTVPDKITVPELQELAKRFLSVCKMGDVFGEYKPQNKGEYKKFKSNARHTPERRMEKMNDKIKKEVLTLYEKGGSMNARLIGLNKILVRENIPELHNAGQMYTLIEKIKNE